MLSYSYVAYAEFLATICVPCMGLCVDTYVRTYVGILYSCPVRVGLQSLEEMEQMRVMTVIVQTV